MKGKAYLNRKPLGARNCGDLYDTPMSLVWALLEKERFNNILEPTAGNGAILKALEIKGNGMKVAQSGDIITGQDFFQLESWTGDTLTNFPFTNWDSYELHAKRVVEGRICIIGRGNYLGTVGRSRSGIWDGLKMIYYFN